MERRFAPRFIEQTETIFALANGYLGIRGSFEEGRPVLRSGTFVNGFHETWPIPYGEAAHGFARTGQTMLNVADAKLIRLYVDDEPFALEHANLHQFERILDMRSAILGSRQKPRVLLRGQNPGLWRSATAWHHDLEDPLIPTISMR